jgi:hypothetical protein
VGGQAESGRAREPTRHRDGTRVATARSRGIAGYRDGPGSGAAPFGRRFCFQPRTAIALSGPSETQHPIWPRGCLPMSDRRSRVSGE